MSVAGFDRGQKSEKIVPEQVKAAAQHQVFPGKSHNFLNFLPVVGLVAMNMTMLANRPGVERAMQSSLNGVMQENSTGIADRVLLKIECTNTGNCFIKSFFVKAVMNLAVNRGELGKNAQIFYFLTGQFPGVISSHGFYSDDSRYFWIRTFLAESYSC